MELKSIKSTSTENVFILTYVDKFWHEFRLQLCYGDLTPIITIIYPFTAYRYCSSGCQFAISQNFDPVAMKKCAKEFLSAIESGIDTKELEEKLRSFKCQA